MENRYASEKRLNRLYKKSIEENFTEDGSFKNVRFVTNIELDSFVRFLAELYLSIDSNSYYNFYKPKFDIDLNKDYNIKYRFSNYFSLELLKEINENLLDPSNDEIKSQLELSCFTFNPYLVINNHKFLENYFYDKSESVNYVKTKFRNSDYDEIKSISEYLLDTKYEYFELISKFIYLLLIQDNLDYLKEIIITFIIINESLNYVLGKYFNPKYMDIKIYNSKVIRVNLTDLSNYEDYSNSFKSNLILNILNLLFDYIKEKDSDYYNQMMMELMLEKDKFKIFEL